MKNYLYSSKVELLDSRFKNIAKEVILGTKDETLLDQNARYILNQVSGEEICVAVINGSGEIIGATNKHRGIVTEINKEKHKLLEIPQMRQEVYLEVLNDGQLASGYYKVVAKNNEKQLVILRELGMFETPIGLVQISTSLEEIDNILLAQVRAYVISTLGALIISGVLVHMILRHTLRPLKKMTSQLDKIDETQLNTRIHVENGQIEIDILANKFNQMFERLEASFEKERDTNIAMKHFILDVSHELRTPLTSIQGFIEILQLGAAKNKEQLDMALESIMIESQRLTKLVNQLLVLVKLEGNLEVEFKEENINEILKEVRSQLEILKGNRKLEMIFGEEMYAMVNKDQIKQIIYNLFQNAINYTNTEKGQIKIETTKIIKENDSWIKVSITDNGEGISEENIELIFDRFFRVDKHRSRKKGGYGLGLSIVKQIITNHHGNIEVQSEIGKGSTFSFLLSESRA